LVEPVGGADRHDPRFNIAVSLSNWGIVVPSGVSTGLTATALARIGPAHASAVARARILRMEKS